MRKPREVWRRVDSDTGSLTKKKKDKTMIKPKTKKQKDQDKKHLHKCAHECAAALRTFIQEVWDGEFRLDWIYLSTINKMQAADNAYNYAKTRLQEECTFTSYEEDHKHKQWRNCTHIDKYDS